MRLEWLDCKLLAVALPTGTHQLKGSHRGAIASQREENPAHSKSSIWGVFLASNSAGPKWYNKN